MKRILKMAKPFQKKSQNEEVSSRITNETVAEHRERILAGGRKFKYPIQYARHKLVINALLITLASVIILAVIGWHQLYIAQNSTGFMYRITRVIPVPVATINDERVRFSDYLVQYRGSEHYLSKYDEIKLDSPDGKRLLDHMKRQSMDKALENAYARQVAREKNLVVTDKDVDAVIDQQRNTANGRISQETYDASSMMMYGWYPSDYRLALRQRILRTRVAFAVDDKANVTQKQVATLVQQTEGDFAKAIEELKKVTDYAVTASQTGLVSTSGTFGGLQVSEVAKLEKGQLSSVMKSTTDDGYYFVKIIDKNDTQVDFAFIHIPLTTFKNDFEQLRKDGKVSEYISIPEEK